MAQHELIADAFSGNVKLAKKVHDAMLSHPADAQLFIEIAKHVCALRSGMTLNGADDGQATEPTTKKRKLENGAASPAHDETLPDEKIEVIFEVRDLSFSMPMRKKLHLEIAQASSPIADREQVYQVRARNPASGDVEYKVGMQSFKHALRLPVPEKAAKQYNFVLIPEAGLGIGDKLSTSSTDPREPLVWTVSDTSQKHTTFNDNKLDNAAPGQNGGRVEQTLNTFLGTTMSCKIVEPDHTEFESATPEAHRKGEKAYHVKAFKGSKDGYLFFLATGIFFGFKKPLAFFPFEVINSISYTSVLQRTFNLNIAVQILDQEETKEHEFSMIDQADFAGIDAYIKRHGLQDASLAESRKAKKVKLNGTVRGKDEGNGEEKEQSELQKAQQDIEDAEDEEEEDYDPGSEGFSDGSGDSSEEEEYEDDKVAGGDQDLVADEPGSEAEEVVPDPDDDDQL